MADEQIVFPGPNISVFESWLRLDKLRARFFHHGVAEIHKITTADLTLAWSRFEQFDEKLELHWLEGYIERLRTPVSSIMSR